MDDSQQPPIVHLTDEQLMKLALAEPLDTHQKAGTTSA